jgi:hypothetical protein
MAHVELQGLITAGFVSGLLGFVWVNLRRRIEQAEESMDLKIIKHSDAKDEAKREHDAGVTYRMDRQWELIQRKLDEAKHDLICANQKLNLENVIEREVRPIRSCIANIDKSLQEQHGRLIEITEWMKGKIDKHETR